MNMAQIHWKPFWRSTMNRLMTVLRKRKGWVLIFVLMLVGLLMYKRRQNRSPKNASFTEVLLGEGNLRPATQAELDYIGSKLYLSFDVIDNLYQSRAFGEGGDCLTRITLKNTGNRQIEASAWSIYGYFIRPVEPNYMPYPNGLELENSGLKLFHLDGNLYRFEPDARTFSTIQPGGTLFFYLQLAAFQVSRTDSMPNWYVAAENLSQRLIASTVGENLSYVGSFDSYRKWKRRTDDPYHPFTALERYRLSETTTDLGRPGLLVLPTPLDMKVDNKKSMVFKPSLWSVVDVTGQSATEAKFLADAIGLHIVKTAPKSRCVYLTLSPFKVTLSNQVTRSSESYIFKTDVAREVIEISANDNRGMFYAVQTLLSLFDNDWPEYKMPDIYIKDAPRFEYRGLHVDVARNFIGKSAILRTIDAMAMYKLNRLHLHLSDDEGWRLEIPGIPELTQIGSKRCHDPSENLCLMPFLGSGPFKNTSGTGFYTISDYRDILRYANDRHVTVIPEFDMPGHSMAALKSIHSKEQQKRRRQENLPVYAIKDDDDSSQYRSGQLFANNVINPCLQSTYDFVSKILSEVKVLHKDIQPLKFYHFGGDEVASGSWDGSKACQHLAVENGDPSLRTDFGIMQYFIKNLAKLAAKQNMSIGAWEDGMLDRVDEDLFVPFERSSFANREIYAFVWKRAKESRSPYRALLFANGGYKVVLAYGSSFYFDHPYEPDPEERGLYWATRHISTRKAWEFSLDVLFEEGEPCPVSDSSLCQELKHPENVVGLQAELWSETVRTSEQMDYMVFPRLLALAERAWHKADWEDNPAAVTGLREDDWINFANTLGYKELRRLDRIGVKYRVPPPGAIIRFSGKLKANVEYPGLAIEYSSDNGKTWAPVNDNTASSNAILKLRTKSADNSRASRVIELDESQNATNFGLCHHPVKCNIILCLLLIYFVATR